MIERGVDLGDQRLILGQNLGDDFVRAIESPPSKDDLSVVKAVRQRLSSHPETKLIGVVLRENEGLKDVEASLCRQMGLPPGSRLEHLRDRLIGREKDFLLVVTGLDQLPVPDRKRVEGSLKKYLKIEKVFG